jgi:hypothetical protein
VSVKRCTPRRESSRAEAAAIIDEAPTIIA